MASDLSKIILGHTRIPSLSVDENGTNATDGSTFNQNLAIQFKKVVNCISVDVTGKYAVLGGKKGLYIIDLDEPYESTRTLNQQSKWEVSVVEWNPHKERSPYIASAANQETHIWNLSDERMELQATLQTHQRAVSDLAWSLFDRNILASCSADTFINIWDIRDPKKPLKKESFCGWTAGATGVKWNRHNPMILASAHNGEVRVWDIRKVSNPLTFITAHMAKIYGIDWSHTDENDLVTCSEDKQVKFWDVKQPRVCQGTLQSGVPILRAKYTPFGRGLVTMAQRSDYTLRLWSLFDLNTPVKQFSGHTDVITSFDWRTREINGAKEYQLVTWSKDQHLRLWCIDKSIQEACGIETSPIPIIPQRQTTEDISSRSISPVDRLSPSPYGIKNLPQEFSMLEKRRPKSIILEEMSVSDRFCIVGVTGRRKFRMKVTFPSHYPNGAAPSFHFLPPTTLSTQNQVKIVESLTETAGFHVENNRPCLYQCLCQLILLLKDIKEIEGAPGSSPPSAFGNSAFGASPNVANDNIPCPRVSGAVFSVTGKLFFFNNFKSSQARPSFPSHRIRTYRDLKGWLQEVPSSDMAAAVPSVETSSFFSNYFYSQQNYQVESIPLSLSKSTENVDNIMMAPSISTLSSFSTPHFDSLRSSGGLSMGGGYFGGDDDVEIVSNGLKKVGTSNAAIVNSSVYIKDVSYLMPLNTELATMYTVSGDIATICRANVAAAEAVDRQDLVQVWTLVEAVMSPEVYRPDEPETLGKIPWSHHPMGRKLIMSIFKHYERLRDVQTLAVLSCVLEQSPQPEKQRNEPYLAYGSSLKMTKTSIVFTPKPKNLLDPLYKDSYDRYRMYYADILYRWQLLDKRAEILKMVKQPGYANEVTRSSLEFCAYCSKCNRALQENRYCGYCKSWGFNCSICHIAVRGSAMFCLVCGHGGHGGHISQWFSTENSCPAGCGCTCIYGNYRGESCELIVKHSDKRGPSEASSDPLMYLSSRSNSFNIRDSPSLSGHTRQPSMF